MLRMSWLASLLVVVGGCGKHAAPGNTAGSGGSGSAQREWQFDQFVDAPHHRLAVVRAENLAALVDGSGAMTPAIDMATTDDIVAHGDGRLVLLASRERAHGLDASGHEVWSVARRGRSTTGTATFADASAAGSRIYALATGKAVYDRPSTSDRTIYHQPDGYVFGSAKELWFVDEATGKERWRQPIYGLADAAINVRPASVFVMHPDRTFQELEYTTGKLVAQGMCEGEPPPDQSDRKPSQCAGEPKVDFEKEMVSVTVKDSDGAGDYYVLTKGKVSTVIARDPVGRVRWKTPAPVDDDPFNGVTRTDAEQVAFVSGRAARRVLSAFDDKDGKLLWQHPLRDGDRVLADAGTCWLVVDRTHASCLDARTGSATWSVVTSSETVDAKPLTDGEALLLEGNPITLSRIGKDGQRRWQTKLPATTDTWQFSDALGIVAGDDRLVVIDLANGKVATVHP